MVMLSDPGKVIVSVSAFASIFATVAIIARSILRYAEIRAGRVFRPEVSDATTARLERIEQAMDAIAIEVERISEGQRFTTKLLADRAEARVSPPQVSSK